MTSSVWAGIFIHRKNIEEQQFEALGTRLRSQHGSYGFQLSPWGEFLSDKMTALGIKRSTSLKLLAKRELGIPWEFDFTDEELKLLKRSNRVKRIDLFNPEQIPRVLQHVRLTHLGVGAYRLTGEDYAAIRSHTSLKSLSLHGILFDQTLIDVLEELPNLKKLTMSICYKNPDSKLVFKTNQRFTVRFICNPYVVKNSSNYMDSLPVDFHEQMCLTRPPRLATESPENLSQD